MQYFLPEQRSRNLARISALLWLIASVYGLIAAGYVSLASHELHLFLPGILVLTLLVIRPKLISSVSMPWLIAVGVFFLLSLTSATFGEHGNFRALAYAVFTVVPLFGLAFKPNYRMIQWLLRYSVVVTLAICTWVFSFYLFFAEELGRWQLVSASGSGNLYGAHLNMIWPILLGWALSVSPSIWKKSFLLILVLACIVATLLSFSRIAFATALGLSALLLSMHQRPVFIMICAGTITLVFIIYWDAMIKLLEFYRIVNFEPEYPRPIIWEYALNYSNSNFMFGASPGGAVFALAELEMYHAHNNVVNTFVEMGVVPGLMMAIFTIYLLILGVRSFLAGGMARYVGCGIWSYIAYSLNATPIYAPELTLTLILLVTGSRYLLAGHRR